MSFDTDNGIPDNDENPSILKSVMLHLFWFVMVFSCAGMYLFDYYR